MSGQAPALRRPVTFTSAVTGDRPTRTRRQSPQQYAGPPRRIANVIRVVPPPRSCAPSGPEPPRVQPYSRGRMGRFRIRPRGHPNT